MNIVLWKIGQLYGDYPILPTKKAIEALEEKINKHFEDGKNKEDLHIVWGPELHVEVIPVPDGPVQTQFNRQLFPLYHCGT